MNEILDICKRAKAVCGELCRGCRRKFRRLEPSKRHANQPHSRAAGGARYHLALFDLLWWQAG